VLCRHCLPFRLTYAARSYTCVLPFSFGIRVAASGRAMAASRRIASQTPRVASLCVLACVSCTYYHRCNARERTISIIIINPPAQRDRKMHLARGRTGNSRMHEDNTLRIIIKGRGRKLRIYEITIYRYYNLRNRKRILYVICVVNKTIR